MKVGLIQVDGKMPNRALMVLARFHRERGDDVTIIDLSTHQFDRTYGSKIFMGGSGYDLKSELPEEIELLAPDYELFKTNYSIGFMSRGCMRDCDFCIVREKEGYFRDCEDLTWIKHTKVLLLDNNFLASKKWKEKLQFFIDNGLKVSFNQGLDIRFINKENATMLKEVKYYDGNFRRRRLYFAFDNPKLEQVVVRGVKILNEAGIPPQHLLFYMLIDCNTTFEEDYNRFEVLDRLGCLPFVMIYNKKMRNVKASVKDFARWVNKRYYKVVTFKDYDRHFRRKRN